MKLKVSGNLALFQTASAFKLPGKCLEVSAVCCLFPPDFSIKFFFLLSVWKFVYWLTTTCSTLQFDNVFKLLFLLILHQFLTLVEGKTMADNKAIPVRVALRIRPLVQKEVAEGSQAFISKVPGQPQVVIKGSNEAYTYDYAFGPEEGQTEVYETAVTKIVHKVCNLKQKRFSILTTLLCNPPDFQGLQCHHPCLWPNWLGEDIHHGHSRNQCPCVSE